MEQHRIVLRATMSFWLYIVVAVICVGAVLWTAIVPEARKYFLDVLPIPLLVVVLGWVTIGWPALIYDRDRLVFRNPLVTWDVPLDKIERSATRGGFGIVTTDERQINAWAAPPPDRMNAWRANDAATGRAHDPRITRGADPDGRPTIRTSQYPGSPSGDAAMLLEHQRTHAGRARGSASESGVRRHWNVVNLVLLALLPVAIVAITVLKPR